MENSINTTQDEQKLTESQFRSLHLFFEQTAKLMQQEGVTMTAVLNRFILEVPATKQSVKEMWKILQFHLTGKESTKELLKKEEIDQIYMSLVKFFAQEFDFELPPFPSQEEKYYKK